MVGRICPRCQSFDVREMTVQVIGADRHAYVCHDCLSCSTTSTSAPTIPCQ